jgi:hypothetical protein
MQRCKRNGNTALHQPKLSILIPLQKTRGLISHIDVTKVIFIPSIPLDASAELLAFLDVSRGRKVIEGDICGAVMHISLPVKKGEYLNLYVSLCN